jgi:DNA-binding transcriptional ArsR family regulator
MTTPEALAARLAPLCSLLAHPARLALLAHLAAGELPARELERRAGIAPGSIYHHLRLLASAGLVGSREECYAVGGRVRRQLFALTPGVRPGLLAEALGLAAKSEAG